MLKPREMCFDTAAAIFASQFGIFMFSTQQMWTFCIKMRLKMFCCCHRNRKVHSGIVTVSLFVPLCASFPYGLMNLHKFSACIIPATIASSSPRESLEWCSKNGATMKREKLICRRRLGSRNLWCILSCVSSFLAWIVFVWGWALIYFPIHFIISLKSLLWFFAWRTEIDDSATKEISPFTDEGWTRIHCEGRAMM